MCVCVRVCVCVTRRGEKEGRGEKEKRNKAIKLRGRKGRTAVQSRARPPPTPAHALLKGHDDDSLYTAAHRAKATEREERRGKKRRREEKEKKKKSAIKVLSLSLSALLYSPLSLSPSLPLSLSPRHSRVPPVYTALRLSVGASGKEKTGKLSRSVFVSSLPSSLSFFLSLSHTHTHTHTHTHSPSLRRYLDEPRAGLRVAGLPPEHGLHPAVLDFLVRRHCARRAREQRERERERERERGGRAEGKRRRWGAKQQSRLSIAHRRLFFPLFFPFLSPPLPFAPTLQRAQAQCVRTVSKRQRARRWLCRPCATRRNHAAEKEKAGRSHPPLNSPILATVTSEQPIHVHQSDLHKDASRNANKCKLYIASLHLFVLFVNYSIVMQIWACAKMHYIGLRAAPPPILLLSASAAAASSSPAPPPSFRPLRICRRRRRREVQPPRGRAPAAARRWLCLLGAEEEGRPSERRVCVVAIAELFLSLSLSLERSRLLLFFRRSLCCADLPRPHRKHGGGDGAPR